MQCLLAITPEAFKQLCSNYSKDFAQCYAFNEHNSPYKCWRIIEFIWDLDDPVDDRLRGQLTKHLRALNDNDYSYMEVSGNHVFQLGTKKTPFELKVAW